MAPAESTIETKIVLVIESIASKRLSVCMSTIEYD
jgi:hypothetical protein